MMYMGVLGRQQMPSDNFVKTEKKGRRLKPCYNTSSAVGHLAHHQHPCCWNALLYGIISSGEIQSIFCS